MTSSSPDPDALADEVNARLLATGVSMEEIESARRAGAIGLLVAAQVAVPGEPTWTSAELAEHVGMDQALARRFWRALGFPDPGEDERVFTDADAEALATVNGFIELGISDIEVAIQVTRVLGSSMARVAAAQIAAGASLDRTPEFNEFIALTIEGSLQTQARQMEYVWRRHLQAASRRALVAATADGAEVRPGALAVGFADLVGFTALSQQLDDHSLAEVVARFEALAFDSVAAGGGRVVKMIGDEVMFVSDDLTAAVETALGLSEAYADDDLLSDVRVGLAWGPTLGREGDYYGPVVNRASRIVNIALPGSVVVADEVHDAIGEDPRYSWRSLRPRYLKDIGRVRLWAVRRPGEDDEDHRARRRARRARVGRAVREVIGLSEPDPNA